MRVGPQFIVVLGIITAGLCRAADVPARSTTIAVAESNQFAYYWKAEPVAHTAQLLTLFCRGCGSVSAPDAPTGSAADVPLVAVLRDTLGDSDAENDRVTDVWLLGYANPGIGKKLLSAVPFFYWHPGGGSKSGSKDNPKPLFDLTAPQHSVLSEVGRDLVQWTAFDPMIMPVRATTRAYRANSLDDERLHLDTAISYLRSAPSSNDGAAPTRKELDIVIARLELRKKLLGGLVNQKRAAQLGQESGFEQERIRSRNWELLRQCAEKTGLVFQSLDLAGTEGEYGMLWFPTNQATPMTSTDLKPIWKILNISDPWNDPKLAKMRAQYVWAFDTKDSNVPAPGIIGQQQALVPLAVYSLSYPKTPLLLVDFRDQIHVRGHEMLQRSINEVTAGVIGISHFTNWYYYVAAGLYDFVSSRHGGAVDQAARLDAYSRLRVALALDRQLDPELRKSMEVRLRNVSINPLEAAPGREMRNASVRYTRLQEEAGAEGHLAHIVDQQRRAEIASFGESGGHRGWDTLLHTMTLGLYRNRAPRSPDNLAKLNIYRRVEYELAFLDKLAEAGTEPEVSYDPQLIHASVEQLASLMPEISASSVRTHAVDTLRKLKDISQSSDLQADCSAAIASLINEPALHRNSPTRGIVAETIVAESGK